MTALARHNNEIRSRFPALARKHYGRPAVFFDGPAGTQVPQAVIEAMTRYLRESNANHGGAYPTSIESDAILREAHRAMAEFVGATDPDEIIFGANMTSLTFALSRALAKSWRAGDEVVVTRLDHDANITPWVLAAREAGAVVRSVGFDRHDCTLDIEQFRQSLNDRTKFVAVACASNATGGINPIAEIAAAAHAHGAVVFADAVHYAPHRLIEVAAWGVDFLACSAYKFFGPHVGVLWGRRNLLAKLPAYKVRPAPETLPGKWMTGTQNHEGIAGTMACVDYLADLGRLIAGEAALRRREALLLTYEAIARHEQELARQFLAGVAGVEGLTIYGITDLGRLEHRCPTFSFTLEGVSPPELARRLADEAIFAWHGDYYAADFHEDLGLAPQGTVRLGMVHYNNAEEVQRAIDALAGVARSR
jgi:cysteine desulfurase family protein (TIGR01976 family)